MYQEGHPTREGGFQQLIAAMDRALAAASPLKLIIHDTNISVGDEAVYTGDPGSDNLAFVLFRDGLRELIFYPEIPQDELLLLVDAIANVDSIDRWDHDLVTTLWEADFLHIDYVVADPLMTGAEISTEIVDSLRNVVLRRLAQAEDAIAAMPERTLDTPSELANTPSPSDETALRRLLDSPPLDAETVRQMAADPCPLDDLYLFLTQLLPKAETPEAAAIMIGALVDEIAKMIKNADLETARHLINLVHDAAGANPAVVAAVEQADFRTPELARAVRLLLAQRSDVSGDREGGEEDGSCAQLLLTDPTLRPILLPVLLDLLADEEDRAVRRSLLAILTARRDLPSRFIVSHLDDHRWYVVRNMVQLLAVSPDARPDLHLRATVHHPDERVRKEVIRTLERMAAAGQDSSPLLRVFLRDSDSGVRTLAARIVGPSIGERGMREVLSLVERPDFSTRPESESEAVFSAIARLARAGLAVSTAVETLESLWQPQLWRKKSAALRTAALRTLGSIPGDEATRSLRRAAKSRDPRIRLLAEESLSRKRIPENE
ncbi:MAG: hypothetical protein GX604_06085 [Actinobacteria bacterium]|nr:hypothetical protein [Actinomycetota bacterium]